MIDEPLLTAEDHFFSYVIHFFIAKVQENSFFSPYYIFPLKLYRSQVQIYESVLCSRSSSWECCLRIWTSDGFQRNHNPVLLSLCV